MANPKSRKKSKASDVRTKKIIKQPGKFNKNLHKRTGPRIYCIGGGNGSKFSECIKCFNLKVQKWYDIPPMRKPRSAPAVVMLKGKLYVLGGYDSGNTPILDSCECFHPESDPTSEHDGKWTKVTSMSYRRQGHAAVTLNGGIYVIGGNAPKRRALDSVEYFDVKKEIWTPVEKLSTPRRYLASVVLDGMIYAIGGRDINQTLITMERYNPKTKKWKLLAPMNERRYGPTAAVLEGYIYVVGGWNGKKNLCSGEKYDIKKNEWTPICSMRFERREVSSVVYNGKLYVIGGYSSFYYPIPTEIYDPIQDSWEVYSGMQSPFVGGLGTIIKHSKTSNRIQTTKKKRNNEHRFCLKKDCELSIRSNNGKVSIQYRAC